jgi:hypothetical protein
VSPRRWGKEVVEVMYVLQNQEEPVMKKEFVKPTVPMAGSSVAKRLLQPGINLAPVKKSSAVKLVVAAKINPKINQ